MQQVDAAATEAFQDQVGAAMAQASSPAELTQAIHNASEAAGVTKQVKMEYPRKVTRLKGLTTQHFQLRAWKKKLVRATRALQHHAVSPEQRVAGLLHHREVEEALKHAPMPEGVRQANLANFRHIPSHPRDSRREAPSTTLIARHTLDHLLPQKIREEQRRPGLRLSQAVHDLQQAAKAIASVINSRTQSVISKQAREAIKKREEDLRNDPGRAIKSIYGTWREQHDLNWARKEDGTLAETAEDLGECVASKYNDWFASVVPVRERWGNEWTSEAEDVEAREGTEEEREARRLEADSKAFRRMMDLDTSQMPTHKYQVGGLGSDAEAMSYQDMAREVYIEPEQYKKAEKEGWFEE
jgi:hypothetical protein